MKFLFLSSTIYSSSFVTLIDICSLRLPGNKYMFYLAASTLACGAGGFPKPSVVTQSRAVVSTGAGGVGNQGKDASNPVIEGVLLTTASSSHFKKKWANTARLVSMR